MKVEEVTTEVCGPVAGPVTILETNDFWRRVLCCFNRRSMGSNFLAGEPEAGGFGLWRQSPIDLSAGYRTSTCHPLLCIAIFLGTFLGSILPNVTNRNPTPPHQIDLQL